MITLKTQAQMAKMREAGLVVAAMLDVCRAAVRPGVTTADLDRAAEEFVRGQGFSVVHNYVGHGIGRAMHEEPQVPNYRPTKGQPNPPISEGLCIAIEPMVNIGGPETRTLGDQWTVVTADRSLSAHFEHTLACTAAGPVVLTRAGKGAAVAA